MKGQASGKHSLLRYARAAKKTGHKGHGKDSTNLETAQKEMEKAKILTQQNLSVANINAAQRAF